MEDKTSKLREDKNDLTREVSKVRRELKQNEVRSEKMKMKSTRNETHYVQANSRTSIRWEMSTQ